MVTMVSKYRDTDNVSVASLGDGPEHDTVTGERIIKVYEREPDEAQQIIIVKGYTYTAQDCIDDLVEVATEFPDKLITRDFYRQHGECPERAWTGLFGNFGEFLRQSGLAHTRLANKIKNQTAKHASVDEYRRIGAIRHTLDNVYERENNKRFKTMIAFSDLHDIECDPFYLRVLYDTLKDVQPDVVCMNGDIFDLPEFGKYSTDPREWDVVGRMQAGLDIIRNVREAAPEAQLDFIEGNHEARVVKHLIECSPAIKHLLSGMHDFDICKLFKLDEFEVNYVSNAELHTFTDAQTRKATANNYKAYWGCLMANHFPTGRNYGMPGFHGHHHQHLVWTMHNALYGSYEWHQMGSGHIRTAPYCDGSRWNNGFLVITVDTLHKSVVFDYCTVGDTLAVAAGKYFYREDAEFYPALRKELDARQNMR
jgi:hypothetical protein